MTRPTKILSGSFASEGSPGKRGRGSRASLMIGVIARGNEQLRTSRISNAHSVRGVKSARRARSHSAKAGSDGSSRVGGECEK